MFQARPRTAHSVLAAAGATVLTAAAAVAVSAVAVSAVAVPAVAVPASASAVAPRKAAVRSALALPANCAQAAPGGRVTCSFAGTGAEQTYTVPSATTSTALTVTAVGASGGTAWWSGAGGIAVLNPFSFRAGTTLYVEVGTSGTKAAGVSPGGFNGGGAGAPGRSSGGGASDVRLLPRTRAGSLSSRFIVAGGGGGADGCYSIYLPRGGAAGQQGTDGWGLTGTGTGDSGVTVIAEGGRGGTATAGGAGGWSRGSDPGGAGSFGQGGAGAMGWLPGCGGGGGWYGGGGSVRLSGAGGGSNFLLFPGVSGVARFDQPAGVTISYTPAGDSTTIRAVPSVSRAAVGTWITLAVQAYNVDGASLGDVSARATFDVGTYGICDPAASRCKLTVPGTHAVNVKWFDPKTRVMQTTTVAVTAT